MPLILGRVLPSFTKEDFGYARFTYIVLNSHCRLCTVWTYAHRFDDVFDCFWCEFGVVVLNSSVRAFLSFLGYLVVNVVLCITLKQMVNFKTRRVVASME